MRIEICAIGRLRSGPEKTLIDDYLTRSTAAGRALSLTGFRLTEAEEKRALTGDALKAAEASLLKNNIARGSRLVMLDERGKLEGSVNFANRLGAWRDNGTQDLTFIIGGADGLDAGFRDSADHLMAFGPMTWPHMLVRVLLAEQLYRAVSILSGHPYHRV
ncbi:MAG: 23S rRNA (pseudouridine(1915)-N(3))-methyltransferase RlmH [Parvibaculaceae bacterium]